MTRTITAYITVLILGLNPLQASESPQPLRVAVIGGMVMSGMWQKVASAFEARYAIPVETVISGTKHELDTYARIHDVDLVTMHASDTMVDLAADGILERLTPWSRNAQMIIGSRSDPAHLQEAASLPDALDRIVRSGSPFLIHASGGTFEVYGAISAAYGFVPKDEQVRFTTAKRGFMNRVAAEEGYTLYGVIPFLMQKQHHPQISGFVFDDPKLRRPYLAAISPERRIGAGQHAHAQQLLEFLLSDEVQHLISTFRIDGFAETPVFFPVQP